MSRLREKSYCFPLCLLVSAVLCVIPFIFTKVYYMYGDDYLMNYIANGSYGVEYSDHLIFPRIPFGIAAKFLYGITRSVNWYAVLLAATIALSFAIWHWILIQVSSNELALVISLIMNAIAVPLIFTFTVTGFFAVAAGGSLLYYSFFREKPLKLIIPGTLLMLWGYIIRTNVLLPTLGMLSPLLFHAFIRFIRDKERRKGYLRNAAILAVTAVISLAALFGLRTWERAAYSGDVWTSYRAYNVARGEALDYPAVGYEIFKEGFEEINFTPQEFDLLYRWSFCEKQAFTEKHLLEIAMVQSNAYSKPWRIAFTKKTMKTTPNYYVLLIPALIFLLFIFADRRFRWATGLLQLAMLCAVIVFALCYVRMRFVLRVGIPISIIGIYNILFMTRASLGELAGLKKSKAVRIVLSLLASAAVVVFFGFFLTAFNKAVFYLRNPDIEVSSQAALEEVRSHPDRIYLAESYAFSRMYYYGHPISEIRTIDDYSHLIRSGSWDSFTPRYYRILDELGFKDPDNLISSLLTEDNYYMITDKPSVTLNYLNSISDRKVKVDAEDLGDGELKLARFHY